LPVVRGAATRTLKAAIGEEVGVGGVGLLKCPDYERQFAKQHRLSQHGQSAHTEKSTISPMCQRRMLAGSTSK